MDTYIQFCGGGYTDGRVAFSFGAQFKRIVSEAIDSNMYQEMTISVMFSVIFDLQRYGVLHSTKQLSSIHVNFSN